MSSHQLQCCIEELLTTHAILRSEKCRCTFYVVSSIAPFLWVLDSGLIYRSQFLAKCETVIFEDNGITKLSACTLNKVEVLHEVISSQRIESASPHQVIVRQSNHYFIAFHLSSFHMARDHISRRLLLFVTQKITDNMCVLTRLHFW